jgi:hypothetical protein
MAGDGLFCALRMEWTRVVSPPVFVASTTTTMASHVVHDVEES